MPNLTSTALTMAVGGERVREALAAAGWPRQRAVWLISHGQWSMADLADALLDGARNAELMAVLWNIGHLELDRLLGYLDDGVLTTARVLVDRSYANRKGGGSLVWPRLQAADAEGLLQVRLADVHTKMFLLSAGDVRAVAGGSSNWNLARRIEDARLENNAELYEQARGFFGRVWDVSAIDRSARSADLSRALMPPRRRAPLGPVDVV